MTSESGKTERIGDISYLLTGLHADFYRSDATAGPVIQGAFGAGHRAHYPEDVLYWSTKGFYEVLDTLYARFPGFLWENCAGGGTIKDFGASRRAAKIQNQDRYYPIDARRSFYDSSYIFPPMQLAALDGSWAECQAAGSVYEFARLRWARRIGIPMHPTAETAGRCGPHSTRPTSSERWPRTKTSCGRSCVTPTCITSSPVPTGCTGTASSISIRPQNVASSTSSNPPKETEMTRRSVKLRGVRAEARYRVTFEDGTNAAVEKDRRGALAGIDVRPLRRIGVRIDVLRGNGPGEEVVEMAERSLPLCIFGKG